MKMGSPHFAALLKLGALMGLASVLSDLVSLGTALAFSIVCLAVMWLRSLRPDLQRPFRVPLGGFKLGRIWIGYVPVAAVVQLIT